MINDIAHPPRSNYTPNCTGGATIIEALKFLNLTQYLAI